jgi:hypothetical protein
MLLPPGRPHHGGANLVARVHGPDLRPKKTQAAAHRATACHDHQEIKQELVRRKIDMRTLVSKDLRVRIFQPERRLNQIERL